MVPPIVSPARTQPPHLVSVNRQPIFRSDFGTYGYEIFFDQPQLATPAMLTDFARKEISSIVGSNKAFINVTREFILSGYCDRLPANDVVLEVLEDVPADTHVIAELTRLSKKGYRIALDDFVFAPEQVPLVDVADIIKIDFLATADLDALVKELRFFDVELLAEKIETNDALRLAEAHDFDYFQGFLLGRPSNEW